MYFLDKTLIGSKFLNGSVQSNRIIEIKIIRNKDANECKGHKSTQENNREKRNFDDELLPTEMQLAFIRVDKRRKEEILS